MCVYDNYLFALRCKAEKNNYSDGFCENGWKVQWAHQTGVAGVVARRGHEGEGGPLELGAALLVFLQRDLPYLAQLAGSVLDEELAVLTVNVFAEKLAVVHTHHVVKHLGYKVGSETVASASNIVVLI